MEPHSVSVDDDLNEAAKKVTVSVIVPSLLVFSMSFIAILTPRLHV